MSDAGTGGALLSRTAAVAAAYRRPIVAVLVLAALVLPLVVVSSITFLVSLVFIYAVLAYAAVVPVGYTGQLVLSQGAFFGVGAYTFVILSNAGVPTWITLVVGAVLGAAVAFLLGWPVIRTSGVYLAIATLAFNKLFVMALSLFPSLFGGSKGLATPELWFPEALTAVVEKDVLYYYVALAAFVGVYLLMRRTLGSQVGGRFLAVRENQLTAESAGIDTRRYRLLSFTIAGAVCGLAGGLYAPLNGYISPPVFSLDTSINILLVAALGGLTSPIGALIGAGVVILVPEYLRVASEFRILVYGVVLVLLFVYVPNGIVGLVRDRLE